MAAGVEATHNDEEAHAKPRVRRSHGRRHGPHLRGAGRRLPGRVLSGEKEAGKFHIEYVNGKPVTVIDTVVSVCGKVPRPSVVYVLTVKNIDYEWETLKQDFMPLILATVKKAPF